ncbi:MAG: ribosome maturation factor RimM [Syntrophobacteraceae bacterium]
MGEPRLVAVGRIVRTHGVRGAVKVFAYGETLRGLGPGVVFLVRHPSASLPSKLTAVEIRPQGKHLLMRFEEILGMESAEALVGADIQILEEQLPPLEEGEFYHFQLIGLNVVTAQGKPVGTIRSIMEAGGHDVYVVDRQGGEALIPAVEEVIREIDLEGGRMVIDPPEGLIDDL